MSDQVFKDRNGRIVGYIQTGSDGRPRATDRNGRVLGTYDPRRNITADRNGRTLAQGNVLSGLIYDQR